MALKVIKLGDLLKSQCEEKIIVFLNSYETINSDYAVGADDVQIFLRTKAVQFEKMGLSRTYFAMSTYQGTPFIAGYFSISNKPLSISKKNFKSLSTSLRKRLMGVGYKSEQENYEIKGYLLGQLGKNYSEIAKNAKAIDGDKLLALAYKEIKKAYNAVGGRVLYLECENHYRIEEFYTKNGFKKLETMQSKNNQSIMIKKLEDL